MSIATTGVSSQQSWTPGSPPASFVIPNTITYQQASEIYATLSQTGLGDFPLTPGVDFSVSAGPSVGGTLTRIGSWVAYAAYGTITIYRRTSPTNNLSIPNGGAIDGPTLAQQIDEIDQVIQEMNPSHLLQAPLTDPPGLNYIAPPVAQRANQASMWDVAGNLVAGQPAGAPINAAWQAALAQNLASVFRAALGAPTEPYTPTAGYIPAAADVVELLSDGTIRKAKRVGTLQPLFAGVGQFQTVGRLDASHAVAFYVLPGDTKTYAVIVNINPVDMTPTLGTPLQIGPVGSQIGNVTPIDTTHVLLTYQSTAAGQIVAVVATANIGAGTLSLGSTANGAASTFTNFPVFCTGIPGTTSSFIAWYSGATTINGAVITISGTTPTFQASSPLTVTASGGYNWPYGSLTVNLAGTFALLSYNTNTPFTLRVASWTISGNTATQQADTATSLVGAADSLIDECGANEYAILTTRGPTPFSYGLFGYGESVPGADFFSIMVQRVSAYGPSMKAADRLGGVLAIQMINQQIVSGATQAFSFFVKRMGGAGSPIKNWVFGDVFRYTTNMNAGNVGGAVDVLSSGIAVFVTPSVTSGGTTIIALRRRNMILGVAVDAVGTVQRQGIFVTSGLTPGAKYYADDSGALTTTPGEVEMGVAIDSTHLALAVRPGV